MRIVITGTPGTGKTAIAKELGKLLKCRVIHVNDMIKTLRIYTKIEKGEMVADLGKLRKALARLLKEKNIILESHLLCEFGLPADIVIVFRCNPRELEKRLKKRKYSREKIKENVLSEILDYCLIKAEGSYGREKVMQIDASRRVSAKKLFGAITVYQKRHESKQIRWLRNPASIARWLR